jgi:uncharacterized protein (TIGR00266 family)
MKVQVKRCGAFSTAMVYLDPGESYLSESGAMFRASSTIDIDVTTKTRGKGGIFAGLKRLLAADNFFFSTYTARGGPGEVGLAPTLPGDVAKVKVDENKTSWLCAGGSYIGSSPGLSVDTQFQGFKGLFTGESIFFVEVSGTGDLLVSAFGHVSAIDVAGEGLIVDTGHVVAYESTLEYEVTKAGSSWFQSWLAGEGMVLKFKGHGRVLVQSHNPSEFGRTIGPMLPPRG